MEMIDSEDAKTIERGRTRRESSNIETFLREPDNWLIELPQIDIPMKSRTKKGRCALHWLDSLSMSLSINEKEKIRRTMDLVNIDHSRKNPLKNHRQTRREVEEKQSLMKLFFFRTFSKWRQEESTTDLFQLSPFFFDVQRKENSTLDTVWPLLRMIVSSSSSAFEALYLSLCWEICPI